jgi:galactokinase
MSAAATSALAPAALAAWFETAYGAPPDLIWRAPGRVNLIGEHTDYNGGLVLPFAVSPSVLAAVSAAPGERLELRSRQRPGESVAVDLGALEPGSVPGWAAYAAGAAWALQRIGYPVSGTRMAIDSDLPIGAGLASSAALCCATVASLAALRSGPPLNRRQIAELARSAEAEFAGVPCGIMDQSASMLCQDGQALLLDCAGGATELVPLDPDAAGLRLIVADTGVRHWIADGQYAARRAQCEQAASLLGVASLAEITQTGPLERLADPLLRRRARHVVTENQRVRQVAKLLRAGRLADCGALLTDSHVSLRDDFEVSWPQADLAVEVALNSGALGARMTGGGFGGSVLVLAPAGRAAAVAAGLAAELTAASRARVGDTQPVTNIAVVRPGPGARPVWPERALSRATGSHPD